MNDSCEERFARRRASLRAMPPIANASDLLVLLQAPSKQSVDTFFSFAFSSRERAHDASLLAEVAAQFSCTPAQAERLYRAAAALIREAMAAEVTAESAAALFPADFHADLRALIVRVVVHHLDEWRAESLASGGGLAAMPRLESTSWHVYRKPAEGGGVATPTHVEMGSEQLGSLLEGLTKIKTELDKVVQR